MCWFKKCNSVKKWNEMKRCLFILMNLTLKLFQKRPCWLINQFPVLNLKKETVIIKISYYIFTEIKKSAFPQKFLVFSGAFSKINISPLWIIWSKKRRWIMKLRDLKMKFLFWLFSCNGIFIPQANCLKILIFWGVAHNLSPLFDW